MAERGLPAILSYAGRTEAPRIQPVPIRIGGFGGAGGLADWLRANRISRIVDATHPFAAQISRNAVTASALTGLPLLAFQRPEWNPGPGDDWTETADIAAAAQALAGPGRRVFLAIGRQNLAAFARQPQHHYLLRLVDPPASPPPLPDHHVVIARGPFDLAGDQALLTRHRIDLLVAKNAGGTGAEAKLIAARALRIPVLMIARPTMPDCPVTSRLEEVLNWCHADLGV